MGYSFNQDASLPQAIRNSRLSHGVSGVYCISSLQHSQKTAADWVYLSPYSVLLESDVCTSLSTQAAISEPHMAVKRISLTSTIRGFLAPNGDGEAERKKQVYRRCRFGDLLTE